MTATSNLVYIMLVYVGGLVVALLEKFDIIYIDQDTSMILPFLCLMALGAIWLALKAFNL